MGAGTEVTKARLGPAELTCQIFGNSKPLPIDEWAGKGDQNPTVKRVSAIRKTGVTCSK